MDLFNYVAQSLQTQQSVGIEGLGTFYNEYIPGAFDPKQQSFLPPRIQVAYKKEVEETQNFIQFLMELKSKSETEVKDWIATDIQKVLKDLDFSGKCNLYPLGFLKKKGESFNFEPLQEEHSADHTFFGLPKLSADEDQFNLSDAEPKNDNVISPSFTNEHISNSSTVDEIAEIFKDKFQDDGSVVAVAVSDEPKVKSTENNQKSSLWKWILISLLLILVAAAAYVWFQKPKWANTWFPQTKDSILQNPLLLDGNETDTIDTVALQNDAWADSNLVDSANHDSTALKLKIQANKYLETPPTQVDTFQVIVASFPNKVQAAKQLKMLKNKWKSAQIAYGAQGVRTKIAIGTFTDLDSAENQQKIMQQKGFKEAWILIKKAK